MTATLDLAGGHLRLLNGSTEIDKIGWGTATSAEGTAITAPAANQSLERKAFWKLYCDGISSWRNGRK